MVTADSPNFYVGHSSRGDLSRLFEFYSDREELLGIVDRFQPEAQWSAVQMDENRIVLTDSFLPPCQTGEYPKLDRGFVTTSQPLQIEARVPASALFHVGRVPLDGHGGKRYGAPGHFRVADFNRDGNRGTLWEDSPIVAVTNEWRERMNIRRDANGSGMWVQLNDNSTVQIFTECNIGVGSGPYKGKSEGEMADQAYALVMLAHLMPKIPTFHNQPGFLQINVGSRGGSYLLPYAHETDGVKNAVSVFPLARDSFELVRHLLAINGLSDEAERISSDYEFWYDRSTTDVLVQAIGGPLVHPEEVIPGGDGWSEYLDQSFQYRAQAKSLMSQLSSFVINIPDPMESVERRYENA